MHIPLETRHSRRSTKGGLLKIGMEAINKLGDNQLITDNWQPFNKFMK